MTRPFGRIGFVSQHFDLSVGFGTYARELTRAVATRFPELELRVYVPHVPAEIDPPDGVEVVVVPSEYRRSRLTWWKHVSVPNRAARDRVDLLHFLEPAAPLVRRGAVPCVVSLLDAIPWALAAYRLGRIEDLILRRDARKADRIVTISEHARREISSLLRIDPSRITVTPLAGARSVRSTWAPDRAAPYWLCFGGTEIRKNVETAIGAFDRIRAEGDVPAARLRVVGPTTPGRTYRAIADLLAEVPQATADAVDWLGLVSDEELERQFQGASAVVFPSRYEGFGLPVLEAMGRGVPVVAAATSSLPEVGRDAVALVDPDDVEEFAREMRRIMLDEQYASARSAGGLRTASEFSWERTAEQTMEAYVSICPHLVP